MPYLVKLINGSNETVIHSLSGTTKLQSGSIKRIVNSIPAFSFVMLPNNAGYHQVTPLVTRVTVAQARTGRLVFDGRVLVPTGDMADTGALTGSYTAEGLQGCLHDACPPYATITGTWAAVLQKLLDGYNGQVEAWKQLNLGTVPNGGSLTVYTGPETDYYSTLQTLIVTNHSYEWRVRTGDDGLHYLDVGSQIGESHDSPIIKLGHNLQSMSIESDPTSVISRVIPLGAQKKTATTNTAEGAVTPRISLADIGKPLYIDSADLIAKYGVQAGVQIYDTVTDARQLTALGESYLKGERPATVKYTVSALNLAAIGLETDDFIEGDTYPVSNRIMGVDEPLRVNEVDIDIINEQNAGLTIGDRMKRATDYTMTLAQDAASLPQMQQTISELTVQVQAAEAKAQASADSVAILLVSPRVKLTAGPASLQLTYTISPTGDATGVSFIPEISQDQNTWTPGTEQTDLTGTFTVAAAGGYYVHVIPVLNGLNGTPSPAAYINITTPSRR